MRKRLKATVKGELSGEKIRLQAKEGRARRLKHTQEAKSEVEWLCAQQAQKQQIDTSKRRHSRRRMRIRVRNKGEARTSFQIWGTRRP